MPNLWHGKLWSPIKHAIESLKVRASLAYHLSQLIPKKCYIVNWEGSNIYLVFYYLLKIIPHSQISEMHPSPVSHERREGERRKHFHGDLGLTMTAGLDVVASSDDEGGAVVGWWLSSRGRRGLDGWGDGGVGHGGMGVEAARAAKEEVTAESRPSGRGSYDQGCLGWQMEAWVGVAHASTATWSMELFLINNS